MGCAFQRSFISMSWEWFYKCDWININVIMSFSQCKWASASWICLSGSDLLINIIRGFILMPLSIMLVRSCEILISWFSFYLALSWRNSLQKWLAHMHFNCSCNVCKEVFDDLVQYVRPVSVCFPCSFYRYAVIVWSIFIMRNSTCFRSYGGHKSIY